MSEKGSPQTPLTDQLPTRWRARPVRAHALDAEFTHKAPQLHLSSDDCTVSFYRLMIGSERFSPVIMDISLNKFILLVPHEHACQFSCSLVVAVSPALAIQSAILQSMREHVCNVVVAIRFPRPCDAQELVASSLAGNEGILSCSSCLAFVLMHQSLK
jgi:hypothetical protein